MAPLRATHQSGLFSAHMRDDEPAYQREMAIILSGFYFRRYMNRGARNFGDDDDREFRRLLPPAL